MTTTNLSTLKINYLTQEQYDDALENGQINEHELYLTEANQDISFYKKIESSYTTTTSPISTIPIGISGLTSADMLFVDINGLDLIEDTDYTISGTNIVLTTPINTVGTIVHFVVLRAVLATARDYSTLKGDDGDVSDVLVEGTSVVNAQGVANITKQALGNITGIIQMYAGSVAPTGWLICDGSLVSKTTYANLYAVIGDTYKRENDDTTGDYFRLPDLVGRMPIGVGTSETVVDPTTRTLGKYAGSERVTLDVTQMPVHGHVVHNWVSSGTTGAALTWTNYGATKTTAPNGNQLANGSWHSSSFQAAQGGNGDPTGITETAGNGESHANMPPYLAINFIIAI